MIRSNGGPWSPGLLLDGWAPLFALLLTACASAAPGAGPSAGPAAPSDDDLAARQVTQVALNSLTMRKIDINGCVSKDARYVEEAVARAGTKAGDKCTMLVAHLPDKTWLAVIRAARRTGDLEAGTSQAGSIQAIVTVTPHAEGVSHIDYKP